LSQAQALALWELAASDNAIQTLMSGKNEVMGIFIPGVRGAAFATTFNHRAGNALTFLGLRIRQLIGLLDGPDDQGTHGCAGPFALAPQDLMQWLWYFNCCSDRHGLIVS
jgi:hypothetical protein